MTPARWVAMLPTATLAGWLARFDTCPLPKRDTARVLADVVGDVLWDREDTERAQWRALTVPAVVDANPVPGRIVRRDRLDLTTGFGGMRRPGG